MDKLKVLVVAGAMAVASAVAAETFDEAKDACLDEGKSWIQVNVLPDEDTGVLHGHWQCSRFSTAEEHRAAVD